MSDTSSCSAEVLLASCASMQYVAANVCTDCGDNCTTCDADSCSVCADGYGPVALSNGCSACTSSAGMTTCASDLSTPTGCSSGYSLIGVACVECTVSNCSACSSAAVCTMCMSGYGMD